MRRPIALTHSFTRVLWHLSLFFLSFVFAIAQHLWLSPPPSFSQPSSQISILNNFTPNNNAIPGADSVYRLTFRNSTGAAVIINSLNHTFPNTPGPITIASATPTTNTCGGSGGITLNPGTEPTPGGSAGASGSYNITSGFTIPAGAPGQCIIEFNVNGFIAGNHTDTIPAGALTTSIGTNQDPTSATLQVRASSAATLNKAFSPNTIPGDGRSTVTITITNPNNFPLDGSTTTPTLVDSLPTTPAQLLVDTRPGAPAPSTTCTGGAATSISANTAVQLTGGTIPANGSCTITFPVTSTTSGTFTNTIPVNTLSTQNRISNSNVPSANLSVQNEVSISKSGLINNMAEGTIRTSTFTVSNGGSQLTGLSVTDPLPSFLEIAPTPNARTTCIAGGATTNWATQPTPGASTYTLNTASLGFPAIVPASDPTTNAFGTCIIRVDVRVKTGAIASLPNPAIDNAQANVINRITNFSNDQNRVPPADAIDNFSVIAGLQVGKSYSPNVIAPNNTTRISIRVTNRSPITATGVGYTDNLPTSSPGGVQLVVAPVPDPFVTASCGAPTATATAGASSVSLSGATIVAGATCEFFFDIFAPAGTPTNAVFNNTIPDNSVVNNEGLDSDGVTGTEGQLTAALRVNIAKSFNPSTVTRGVPSRITLTITNNRRSTSGVAEPLTNVAITDNLPTNLQVANPATLANSCNGAISGATPSSTSISLTGGSIAASSNCSISFNVIEINLLQSAFPTDQTYVNTTSGFSNAEGEAATNATANLLVTSPLTGIKSFQSPSISANGISRATIQFSNTDPIPLTNITFTDTWAQANTVIATVPDFQTTCTGGTFVQNTTRSFTFSGGTVPAQIGGVAGICTLSFDVTMDATGANTFTNTLPANSITTTQGFTNRADISGNLARVTNDLSVNKSFSPNALNSVGDPAVLTLSINNPGVGGLVATNLTFVDTMDTATSNILVFPVPSATTSCGGTVLLPGSARPAGLTGAATLAPNEFGLTGGTLAVGTTCTITIRTTSNAAGNRTNTIPANTIRTREGASNASSASATINALPALNISKAFSPTSITGGQISRLTVTVQNRQASGELGAPLSNIRFTDNLPANVRLAATPNPTTTCTNGVFNPALAGGATSFTIQSFELNFNSSCTVAVDVVSNIAGAYVNTIPVSDVSATLQTSIGSTTTTANGPATATLTVTTTVLPPEVVLAKRITRINNTDINGFVDDPSTTDDNSANWPSPTSTSLRGAISQANVRPQDEVEYTIYYLNRGQSDASNLRICDPVPANTRYVPNAYNGSSPTDGGLPADLGIVLQTGTTAADIRFLTGINDSPDRGRYYDPLLGEVPSGIAPDRCPDPSNPSASLTSNPNGIVAVNVNRTSGTPTFPLVPNATAAGTPPTSYGFIRFRVKVN